MNTEYHIPFWIVYVHVHVYKYMQMYLQNLGGRDLWHT